MKRLLSQRLRDETRNAHVAAERSGIMQMLLRGTISRAQYVLLLQQLELIYGVLEAGLRAHHTEPTLAFIEFMALERAPALREDIRFLDATAVPSVSMPATMLYVARLQQLRDTTPLLLGAHAYVRYLGDLSGGQILSRIVRKALHLEDARGTSFYHFPAIADIDAFKVAFRNSLDELELSTTEADVYVAEALRGFALHEQLFEELSAGAVTTTGGSATPY